MLPIDRNDLIDLKKQTVALGISDEVFDKLSVSVTVLNTAIRNANNKAAIDSLVKLAELLKDSDSESFHVLICGLFRDANLRGVLDTVSYTSLKDFTYTCLKALYPAREDICAGRLDTVGMSDLHVRAALCEGDYTVSNILVELIGIRLDIQQIAYHNIRGTQLTYAYEYADKIPLRLKTLIIEKDTGLFDYINAKQSDVYRSAGFAYRAVVEGTGWCSEVDLTINPLNATERVVPTPEPVNAVCTDITMDMSRDQIIAKFESLGWINLWVVTLELTADSGVVVQTVMLNPTNCDFFELLTKDTRIVKAQIVAARYLDSNDPTQLSDWWRDVMTPFEYPETYWKVLACDIHYGDMLTTYASLPEVNTEQIPWIKYPIHAAPGLPMPMFYSTAALDDVSDLFTGELFSYTTLLYDWSVTMLQICNIIRGINFLFDKVTTQYVKCFSAVLDEPYRAPFKCVPNYKSMRELADVLRLCFAITGTPNEEVDKYKDALYDIVCAQIRFSEQNGGTINTRFTDQLRQSKKLLEGIQLYPDALDYYVADRLLPNFDRKITELPKDALDWMYAFAPTYYTKLGDFGLYANMRNAWQRHVLEERGDI